jgi:hypothetical protein
MLLGGKVLMYSADPDFARFPGGEVGQPARVVTRLCALVVGSPPA